MKLFRQMENIFSNYSEKPAVSRFTPPNGLFTLTYGQIEEQIRQFRHFLFQQGMGSGDLVIIYMNKSPELVAIILAIILNGGTACCLNSKLKTFQLLKLSSNAKPKFIIVDQSTLTSILESKELLDENHQFILFVREPESLSNDWITRKWSSTIYVIEYAKGKGFAGNLAADAYYRGDST